MQVTLHGFVRVVLGFAFTLVALFAHAHEVRPAIVDLTMDENAGYRVEIRLNLEAIIANIGPEHSDTSESANAAQYDALRALGPMALAREFEVFKPRFLEGITLGSAQQRFRPDVIDVQIAGVGDLDLARDSIVVLAGQVPGGTDAISWQWHESFGANALRVSSSKVEDLYTAYLQAGEASEPIPLKNVVVQSVSNVFTNYIAIGFAHIIPKGLDHILFVVGLFLLSMKMRPLIWQITSFTLAHSVTLALGILGLVQISASIVEPLIALSIVYVCVENIFSDRLHKWRPVVVFSFGLLHGLGFASVLTEIGLSSSYFITGLIAFNIGIEIGQLSVIALCFFTVGIWFRHKAWYRARITIPASALIAVVGAYWFIERTFL